MRIRSKDFTDLTVRINPEDCFYKVTPNSPELIPFEPEFYPELVELRKALDEKFADDKSNPVFPITWDGGVMRVVRMEAVEEAIYQLRSFGSGGENEADRIRHLQELRYPPKLVEALMAPELKHGGLILFMGKPGSWKSTSAAGLFIERLETYGGLAWTVEYPRERILEGKHGKGQCFQIGVDSADEFQRQIEKIVMTPANMLFIGEIRSDLVAKQAVLAAAGGLIVCSTFHASDLLTGLKRFALMCGEQDLLAECLKAAVFLTLESRTITPPTGVTMPGKNIMPQHRLKIDPLLLTPPAKSEHISEIRGAIRSERGQTNQGIEKLRNVVNQQKVLLSPESGRSDSPNQLRSGIVNR